MARYAQFGKRLRAIRVASGVKSAAELGRLAGLSASHVAMFERGEVRPRWKTAERLADALQLTGIERDEFMRMVDDAGKPESVRDATSGLPIPGAAAWQHLPYLLLQVEHPEFDATLLANDDMLVDTVRVTASLLSWTSLARRPPSRAQRQRLCRVAQSAFDSTVELVSARPAWGHPGCTPIESAAYDTATGLPSLWRNELFRSRPAAEKLVKLLRSWQYHPAGVQRAPRLDVHFRDKMLDALYGVTRAEPSFVVTIHDAMISHTLWRTLELQGRFGPEPDNYHQFGAALELGGVSGAVSTLSDAAGILDEAKRDVKVGAVFDAHRKLELARDRVRVALRLFEVPELVDQILQRTRGEIESALSEHERLVASNGVADGGGT